MLTKTEEADLARLKKALDEASETVAAHEKVRASIEDAIRENARRPKHGARAAFTAFAEGKRLTTPKSDGPALSDLEEALSGAISQLEDDRHAETQARGALRARIAEVATAAAERFGAQYATAAAELHAVWFRLVSIESFLKAITGGAQGVLDLEEFRKLFVPNATTLPSLAGRGVPYNQFGTRALADGSANPMALDDGGAAIQREIMAVLGGVWPFERSVSASSPAAFIPSVPGPQVTNTRRASLERAAGVA